MKKTFTPHPFILVALIVVLLLPVSIFAQRGGTPPVSPEPQVGSPAAPTGGAATFVPLNKSLPGIGDFATSPSIPNLLNNIYKICIGLAAILAVLQIMRAGVLYMGGDSITEKKEAKDLIAMSLIGLLLVLAPTIVFSIINPDILRLQIGAESLRTEFKDSPSGSIATSTTAVDPRTSLNAYTSFKVVRLISKGLISTIPDPTYSCEVGAGATFTPGSGCGPIQSGYQCCVPPKTSTQDPNIPHR